MTADVLPFRARLAPDAISEAQDEAASGLDQLTAKLGHLPYIQAIEIIACEALERVARASGKDNAMALADCASDIRPEGDAA